MNVSKKLTVLVVEDEMLIRMHGQDILEDAGFDVLAASNADEAMMILREHEDVQVLFSDVDMPGSMDGLELANWSINVGPIFTFCSRRDITKFRRQPCRTTVGLYAKPWTHETLIAKIKAALRPRS